MSRTVQIAVGILALLAAGALFAPWLAPHDPAQIVLENAFAPPSLSHPFGTDDLGRDLFSRALYAGRISFSVGIVAVGISVAIGILLGALAGVSGGLIDIAIMRLVDLMLCIPSFFLILAVIAFL
ncbi:MAG: peptide ABC transporter permease, partial [Candidatus Dadabacteria bacterium]